MSGFAKFLSFSIKTGVVNNMLHNHSFNNYPVYLFTYAFIECDKTNDYSYSSNCSLLFLYIQMY